MSYAAEPYAQFVDDLLTGLTGGSTRQRFVFLPEEAPFRLTASDPVIPATVRVFGQADGAFHRFRARDDWNLADGAVIEWRSADGAVRPDPGSDFFVNFEVHGPAGLTPPLTDRNPGSVTRLLAESFGREMAVLSRQMEAVYQAGFIATASGRDLDALVRLVGLERRGGTAVVGSALFSRSTPAPGDVFLPAGTRLATGDVPAVDFETTADATLRRGELSVEVPIAVLSPSTAPGQGVVPAGRVTAIYRPILGIEKVENPQPTRLGNAAESDDALRARARRALEVAGGATTGALRGGIAAQPGLREKDVRLSEDHLTHPGRIEIQVALPGAPGPEQDELGRRAAAAIEELRPAGVRVAHNLPLEGLPGVVAAGPGERPEDDAPVVAAGAPLRVEVALVLTPASAVLSGDERSGLERAARDAVSAFFADLGIGEALLYNRLIASLMALPGVLDVGLAWRSSSSAAGSGPGAPFERRNLFPSDPGVRAALGAVTVEIGGQLVVLHVTARITLRGAGLVGDAAANRAEALSQIGERLRAGLVAGSAGASGGAGVLDRAALEGLLASAESFTAELHYAVDYVEAGVRIRKRDLALPLTGLETIAIASVEEEPAA